MYLDEKTIKIATNPQNVGTIKNAYKETIVNPVCGDMTDLYLKIKNEKIIDAKFQTVGCFVTIASASVLTEVVKGKTIQELIEGRNPKEKIKNLFEKITINLGEIPKQKLHCPPASIEALLKIFKQYY